MPKRRLTAYSENERTITFIEERREHCEAEPIWRILLIVSQARSSEDANRHRSVRLQGTLQAKSKSK